MVGFQFSSVAQSCLTLCDSMDCHTQGFPVHHQLPELAQTHVYWVSDAIQPSNSLLSPSPAFDLSQHQTLHTVVSDSFQPCGPYSPWNYPGQNTEVGSRSLFQGIVPASGSFPMSQFFASGGQSIGSSASVLPMNIQDWNPLGLTDWSLCSPRNSQESSPTPQLKSINSSVLNFFYGPTLTSIHDYWKNCSFDYTDLCWVMCLLFNMLSRFLIAFLRRSKPLLISWLQSPSVVILEPPRIKSLTERLSIVSPSICHEVMGLGAMLFIFWILSF